MSASSDRVQSDVVAIIGKTFRIEPGRVTRETVSEDVDGWDSVSHLHLILALEEHYGVELPEGVFTANNVGGLIDLVDARIRGLHS